MNVKPTYGIEMVFNDNIIEQKAIKFLSASHARSARKFHISFNNYRATPLISLDSLAHEFGVSRIMVKDESYRFGLSSFKVLGGAYAIGRLLCQELGMEIDELRFDFLKTPRIRREVDKITITAATDGNHGMGIAWTASQLGLKAVIYLPQGTTHRRVEAILETGANAHLLEMNYDDSVRYALKMAKKNNWLIVQDTAWKGYTTIPKWIMQGYLTMVDETLDQLILSGIEKPTHVFLQAGVGSLSGSVLGYFVNLFKKDAPKAVIVEPENAACIFKSAQCGDGAAHHVEGDLKTIMAGLACGEPNPVAWEILRDFSTAFASCPDYVAARGMRILANPLGNDRKVISGESGAVSIGLLSLLVQKSELEELSNKLDLSKNSNILIFNTEGDTDPINYREVVWDGKYPSPA